jgi:hypothetical protein
VRAHRGLFCIRNAGEHADGAHGEFGTQVLHEIEAFPGDQRIQAGGAERPHLVFDGSHLLGGESPGHDGTMDGVQRGILVDEDAGWHHRIGHDDFEDVAFGGAEPSRILKRRIDVRVTAYTPEAVLLVVIDRALVS